MILAYFFTFRNALERKFKRHQKYSKIRDVRPPRPTYVTYAVTRVSRMHLPNHNPIQNQKPNQNTSSMHQLQTSAKSTGTHTITKTNTITNTTNFAQTKIIFFIDFHLLQQLNLNCTYFLRPPWNVLNLTSDLGFDLDTCSTIFESFLKRPEKTRYFLWQNLIEAKLASWLWAPSPAVNKDNVVYVMWYGMI